MLRAVAISDGERVLEFACGGGEVGLRAAELVGAGGRVLCTDFAGAMVEVVRERSAGLPQVEARVLDAQDPGLQERFDVVLCRLGYMLMPDPARALRATYDVLDPDGRLALAVWADAARNPWLSLKTDALIEELGAPPPEPGTPGPFALGEHDRLRSLLAAAGYGDIDVEDVTDVRDHGPPEEWWAEGEEGAGPMAAFLAQMSDEQVARVRDAALTRADMYVRDDGRLWFPVELVVASARRPG